MGQDVPIIQGVILLLAVLVILANLVVDLTYGYLNPKVRVRDAATIRRMGPRRPAGASLRGPILPSAGARRGRDVSAAPDRRGAAGAADRAHGPDEQDLNASPGAQRRGTGSAPTSSAATCSAGSSTAPASRSASSVLPSVPPLVVRLPLGLVAGYVGGPGRRRRCGSSTRQIPAAAPGARRRRLARPQPEQRRARHRPSCSCPDSCGSSERRCWRCGRRPTSRRRARSGRRGARSSQARPAQRRVAPDRPGVAHARVRAAGRGRPQLPRPRRPAAGAELGRHAGAGRTTTSSRPMAAVPARASPSCSPCWPSTCWATASATRLRGG